MDRTVSRRSEPSSRAALMGEQPNPWDLLQPQDATSRHRGAKPPRRCGLLGEISLLSPGQLLSVERWHFHSHTTGSLTPTFVTARPVSLAVRLASAFALFCLISVQAERTFERLRYFLGGDRPSQTAYQKLSLALFFEGSRLEFKLLQSGISTMTPLKLTSQLLCLPPILHNKNPNSISSYSKAQQGLSVLVHVIRIFTDNPISPSLSPRQRPYRYAIRAGQNLPDKEFRYLRTVIVTAAVHRGLVSVLRIASNTST